MMGNVENLVQGSDRITLPYDLNKSVVNFILTKHKDIAKVIIPIFNQHLLMSSKHLYFIDYCKVSIIMEKLLLTYNDYKQIELIKSE